MKVGIIIPCYNEEKRLNIDAFRKWLKDFNDFHLCFVNDGSRDKTLHILTSFKEEYNERITIINKKKNQGKSMAIKAGARYFYSISSIKYVGYFDADSYTNFDDFDDLLRSLKQNKKLEMFFGSGKDILLNASKNMIAILKQGARTMIHYLKYRFLYSKSPV